VSTGGFSVEFYETSRQRRLLFLGLFALAASLISARLILSYDFLPLIGVTHESVESGKRLFRRSIDDGGAACASCHTPFHPLEHTEFLLSNPQTNVALPLRVSHHVADADDVAEGLASFVGQPGLRTWGDFKLHKMGARLFSNNTDRAKTAEVWDAGSVFPYARDGSFGSDLRAVIRAHGGVSLDSVTVDVGPQVDVPAGASTASSQTVTLTNQRAEIDILSRRMVASVLLVKALGGGWDVADLPKP